MSFHISLALERVKLALPAPVTSAEFIKLKWFFRLYGTCNSAVVTKKEEELECALEKWPTCVRVCQTEQMSSADTPEHL